MPLVTQYPVWRRSGTIIAIGTALETDTAQTIGRAKSKLIGQASSTDTAQPIAKKKSKAIGIAVETDTADVIHAVGHLVQALETDTAQPIAKKKSKAIGIAVETDTAMQLNVPPLRTPSRDRRQANRRR